MPKDNLYEQIVNISKAGAYDVVSQQVIELKEENDILRSRVKELENLIIEYTEKMSNNLNQTK